MNDWRKDFDEAKSNYEKYVRPEFEVIYRHLLEQDIPAEEILKKEGITYSAELASNFEKYVEAYERGCEAMKQGLMLVEKYCEQGLSVIEAVAKAGIKDEEMRDLALEFSKTELKDDIFFDNLKIEDESIDEFLISEGYECNHSICGYYKKIKDLNLDENVLKSAIKELSGMCVFIKENSKSPIKIQNMITNFMLPSIWAGDGIRLILIIQGLLEWLEKICSFDSDTKNEDAFMLYEWLLSKSSHLYYNYHLYRDQQNETPFDYFFYSTVIGCVIREQEIASSLNTDNNNELFKVNDEIVTKIYNECNGKQWNNIAISEFLNILNSNGENQNLTINQNETNRTKCVFRKVANYIENKKTRKIWIEGIKKNIFKDVDFMKATLQTNKYSAGYSETDANFKPFLDSL